MPLSPREKQPLQSFADASITEPAPSSELDGFDVEASSYAGPWDVDPNWFDDQSEIDDMADAERIASAHDILGWTDLEPIDLDALIGPATSPDQWGFHDTSDASKASDYCDVSEHADDVEDQL